MKRLVLLAAGAVTAACGPTRMDAVDAAQALELFAAGSSEAIDVCAPGGRAALRGAVRAYGAAMAEGGEPWLQDTGEMNAVEASVVVSIAAGFVEASDLTGAARNGVSQIIAQMSDLTRFRSAARVACAELAALQQAAARYVAEAARQRDLMALAQRNEAARERAERNQRRVDSARDAMELAAHVVETRVAARQM